MAAKYLYKCNPLVAKAAGVTPFDRYTWPDGTMLLWENDLIAIDRDRFFLDRDGFLADLGVVKMTDPQAAEEQKNPSIILPEALLPEYKWKQPESEGGNVDGSEDGGAQTQIGTQAGKPALHDEEGGES